jgi:hypothetical protein
MFECLKTSQLYSSRNNRHIGIKSSSNESIRKNEGRQVFGSELKYNYLLTYDSIIDFIGPNGLCGPVGGGGPGRTVDTPGPLNGTSEASAIEFYLVTQSF